MTKRIPIYRKAQQKFSPMDVPTGDMDQVVRHFNDELKRLQFKPEAKAEEPALPVEKKVTPVPKPQLAAPDIIIPHDTVTSNDGSIEVISTGADPVNNDLSVYNYAEKYEYSYYDDGSVPPPGNMIPMNRGLIYDGWIPFTCDSARIQRPVTWVNHFTNRRWKLNADDPTAVKDYMYFKPGKAGVYQVTVSLLLEIDRDAIPDVDDWITDAIVILMKNQYSEVSDTTNVYLPIFSQNIATSAIKDTFGLENVVDMENRAHPTIRIPDNTILYSDVLSSAIGMRAVRKVFLRGTTLVHMATGEALTVWYKFKGGFFQQVVSGPSTWYNWDSSEDIVRAIHINEEFEVNWQGLNYTETNWYDPNGTNLKIIITKF